MLSLNNKENKKKMNIFPYHWHHFEEYGSTKIRIFGLSETNESIYIQIDDFLPYIYIELPQLVWSSTAYHIVQTKLKEISNQNIIKMKPQKKKRFQKNKCFYQSPRSSLKNK